jgi:hypothetical protein
MWPLYFLFNKILKTDEEEPQVSEGDGLSLVELRHNTSLSRSYFVEVSSTL